MTASQEQVSINMVETMEKHQQTIQKVKKKKNTWASNYKQQLRNETKEPLQGK